MIGKPNVISTMAEIVEDLVKGELMQLASMGKHVYTNKNWVCNSKSGGYATSVSRP